MEGRGVHRCAEGGASRRKAPRASGSPRWSGASFVRCSPSGWTRGGRRCSGDRLPTTRSRWRPRVRASWSRMMASCRWRSLWISIAVIGGFAQLGVPVGTESSAVTPACFAAVMKIGGPGIMGGSRNLYLHPSSPLAELRAAFPEASIEFDPAMNPAESALLACGVSDVAFVFRQPRPEGESFDLADLALPWGRMPSSRRSRRPIPRRSWCSRPATPSRCRGTTTSARSSLRGIPVRPGVRRSRTCSPGVVNPSGRLPITFPVDLAQTPRPRLEGLGEPGAPTTVRYDEGAEVGYRWFAQRQEKPEQRLRGTDRADTTFGDDDLAVEGGETIAVRFAVTNTGDRAGADVPSTGPRGR